MKRADVAAATHAQSPSARCTYMLGHELCDEPKWRHCIDATSGRGHHFTMPQRCYLIHSHMFMAVAS